MALGNILGALYSIVAEVHYNRSDKQVSFNLEMYTGSDKSEMISSIAYSLNAANPIVSTGGVITDYPSEYNYSAAPADFDEDKWKTFKKYIIGSGAKAVTVLAGHTGDYFLCPYGEIIKEGADADNPEGTSWSYQWLVTESDTGRIHDDPAGKLWKIGFGTGVVTELPSETFIPSTWDTFFAVSVIDKKDTNIITQCYQYLKSLSAFDDATDL